CGVIPTGWCAWRWKAPRLTWIRPRTCWRWTPRASRERASALRCAAPGVRKIVGLVLAGPGRQAREVFLQRDVELRATHCLQLRKSHLLVGTPFICRGRRHQDLHDIAAIRGADLLRRRVLAQPIDETHAGREGHLLLDLTVLVQGADLALRQPQPQRRALDAQLHASPAVRAAAARIRCACRRCGRSIIWPSRLATPAPPAEAKAATIRRAWAHSAAVGTKAALMTGTWS